MFNARIQTIDKKGTLWADRTHYFQTADRLTDHIKEAIEQHMPHCSKLMVFCHFNGNGGTDNNSAA